MEKINQKFRKKEYEQFQLNHFIKAFKSFPMGSIEPGEEPDFVVQTQDCRIGIELTNLHRNTPEGVSPMQAQERMQGQIVEKASKLFEEAGGKPLLVSVIFNNLHEVNKINADRIAAQISSFAITKFPLENCIYKEEYDWEINKDYFPEELLWITLYNDPTLNFIEFTCPGSTILPIQKTCDIKRVLTQKEAKYKKYRQRCDVVWLLINFNGETRSTMFNENPLVKEENYKTSFDRVFLYSRSGRYGSNLIELSNLKIPE